MFKRRYQIPEAQTAVVYHLKPGDVVVLEFAQHLTNEEAAKVHRKVDRKFAPATVVLLGSGARLNRGQ